MSGDASDERDIAYQVFIESKKKYVIDLSLTTLRLLVGLIAYAAHNHFADFSGSYSLSHSNAKTRIDSYEQVSTVLVC